MNRDMHYFGAVLDAGRDFVEVSTAGPLVALKIVIHGDCSDLELSVGIDRSQAREIARHLAEAALTASEREIC